MNDASKVPEAVSAAIVSDYLRAHPDFFDQNPDVLGELKLAHVSDGAVSLVERQVALLRERNAELRRRFDGLMARAKQNEALLHATQEVISAVAKRSSKDDIASLFCGLVKKSFDVELVAFHWSGDNGDDPSNAVASHLLGNKNATSGPLRAHELKALFDEEAAEGSAALARLKTRQHESAVIAVGSVDATRYGIGEGTLFLEYLADVISSLPINRPVD
jgi:uncharacterized protein YigA (DUF484 family)